MGVLTVDEGGEARAFRISAGSLSMGSGEEMDLVLTAEEVALYHVDLECEDESLYVIPKPGVMPPTIHGVALKKKTRLGPGQELRVGKARVTWKSEGPEPAGAARPAKASSSGQPRNAPSSSGARRKSGGSSSTRRRATGSRRSGKTTAKKGVPGWLIAVGVLAIGGLVAFFLNQGLSGSNDAGDTASSKFHLRKAEEMIASRNAEAAEENLGKISKSLMSADELRRFDEVKAGILAEHAEIERLAEEERGKKWFRLYVGDYEKRYLSGEPEPAQARLFLERCAEFRKRWPGHSQLAWVERQERRFASSIRLSDPLGFDDIMWRVRLDTTGRPRDYGEAFALLEDYRGKEEGSDERIALSNTVNRLKEERLVYHREQLEKSRSEFQKNRVSEATERLVQIIIGIGDEAMADEAAGFLIKFPEIEPILLGYREFRGETFDALAKNQVIAQLLESQKR